MWFLTKNYDKIIPRLIDARDSKKLLEIAQTAGDESVIARAALALGEINDPKTAKSLLYVLKRESYRGKPLNTEVFESEIIQALIRMGLAIIPELVFEISQNTIREDWKVRNAAESVLVGMGKPGVTAILGLLRKPDIRTKEIAIRLLAKSITEAYESTAYSILMRTHPDIAREMTVTNAPERTSLDALRSLPDFVFDESFGKQALGDLIYPEIVNALQNALNNPGISESARKTLNLISRK